MRLLWLLRSPIGVYVAEMSLADSIVQQVAKAMRSRATNYPNQ
jgi:hypothetical protein